MLARVGSLKTKRLFALIMRRRHDSPQQSITEVWEDDWVDLNDEVEASKMIVFVRLLNGKTVAVSTSQGDTVEAFWTALEEHLNVGEAEEHECTAGYADGQRLCFGGSTLNSKERVLEDYGIQNHSTLDLIPALNGGFGHFRNERARLRHEAWQNRNYRALQQQNCELQEKLAQAQTEAEVARIVYYVPERETRRECRKCYDRASSRCKYGLCRDCCHLSSASRHDDYCYRSRKSDGGKRTNLFWWLLAPVGVVVAVGVMVTDIGILVPLAIPLGGIVVLVWLLET